MSSLSFFEVASTDSQSSWAMVTKPESSGSLVPVLLSLINNLKRGVLAWKCLTVEGAALYLIIVKPCDLSDLEGKKWSPRLRSKRLLEISP